MPRLPIDYSKTIIYKIVCNDLNITEVYVGSTTDFTRRKREHKSNCINEKSKKYHYTVYQMMRQNGGFDNWDMIELEKYPCNDSNEARAKERYYYELLNTKLNMRYPIRTNKEYYKDNVIYYKQYNKEYCETNKDKIKTHTKQYYEDNKDTKLQYQKQYSMLNKEKIKGHKTKYRENNKDKIEQYIENNKDKIKQYQKEYYAKKKLSIQNVVQNNLIHTSVTIE
jgi:hypothetical protein